MRRALILAAAAALACLAQPQQDSSQQQQQHQPHQGPTDDSGAARPSGAPPTRGGSGQDPENPRAGGAGTAAGAAARPSTLPPTPLLLVPVSVRLSAAAKAAAGDGGADMASRLSAAVGDGPLAASLRAHLAALSNHTVPQVHLLAVVDHIDGAIVRFNASAPANGDSTPLRPGNSTHRPGPREGNDTAPPPPFPPSDRNDTMPPPPFDANNASAPFPPPPPRDGNGTMPPRDGPQGPPHGGRILRPGCELNLAAVPLPAPASATAPPSDLTLVLAISLRKPAGCSDPAAAGSQEMSPAPSAGSMNDGQTGADSQQQQHPEQQRPEQQRPEQQPQEGEQPEGRDLQVEQQPGAPMQPGGQQPEGSDGQQQQQQQQQGGDQQQPHQGQGGMQPSSGDAPTGSSAAPAGAPSAAPLDPALQAVVQQLTSALQGADWTPVLEGLAAAAGMPLESLSVSADQAPTMTQLAASDSTAPTSLAAAGSTEDSDSSHATTPASGVFVIAGAVVGGALLAVGAMFVAKRRYRARIAAAAAAVNANSPRAAVHTASAASAARISVLPGSNSADLEADDDVGSKGGRAGSGAPNSTGSRPASYDDDDDDASPTVNGGGNPTPVFSNAALVSAARTVRPAPDPAQLDDAPRRPAPRQQQQQQPQQQGATRQQRVQAAATAPGGEIRVTVNPAHGSSVAPVPRFAPAAPGASAPPLLEQLAQEVDVAEAMLVSSPLRGMGAAALSPTSAAGYAAGSATGGAAAAVRVFNPLHPATAGGLARIPTVSYTGDVAFSPAPVAAYPRMPQASQRVAVANPLAAVLGQPVQLLAGAPGSAAAAHVPVARVDSALTYGTVNPLEAAAAAGPAAMTASRADAGAGSAAAAVPRTSQPQQAEGHSRAAFRPTQARNA